MTFARSFRLALGVLAVVSAGSAAAAQDVAYNAMPGTNFAAFKTYKWVEIQGATKPDQIVDQQITTALDAALASKGLTKTTEDKADLLVGYEVAVQQQKEWNSYGTGGGMYGGFRYGGGMTTAVESTINIGTLGVSIYDQAAKQLVWRGSASKTIDPKAKPEKRQGNINKAVVKMLKNYPPPVKK